MRLSHAGVFGVAAIALTVAMAGPNGLLRQRDHGLLGAATESFSQTAALDALAREPHASFYTGQWVSVNNLPGSRVRQAIEFKSNGHFTSNYTVRSQSAGTLTIDESSAGTFELVGRTVVFRLVFDHNPVVRRIPIVTADAVHLDLKTPSGGQMGFTRIFDARTALALAP